MIMWLLSVSLCMLNFRYISSGIRLSSWWWRISVGACTLFASVYRGVSHLYSPGILACRALLALGSLPGFGVRIMFSCRKVKTRFFGFFLSVCLSFWIIIEVFVLNLLWGSGRIVPWLCLGLGLFFIKVLRTAVSTSSFLMICLRFSSL